MNGPPPTVVIVTATRSEKAAQDVPAVVHTRSYEELQGRVLARTIPEALTAIPGVMVQKTSHGQGSPFIRGFTGFRTLFLIDGIRLNNSAFRDGPNQYWNTVDLSTAGRLEIVKGPSSVLFGSDAVGGTVNVITRGRGEFSPGFHWERRLQARASSAERSGIGRLEVEGNIDRFGFFAGTSLKNFGDLQGGAEVGRQPRTGYHDRSGDLKLEYSFRGGSHVMFAYHRLEQGDVWRTHSTIFGIQWRGTSLGSDFERVLGQTRELTYLKYESRQPAPWIQRIAGTLSYQLQGEREFRIRGNRRQDRQGFDVRTIGTSMEIESRSRAGLWTYGLEFYGDGVDSFRRTYDAGGTLRSVEIQGPLADDAVYNILGLFIENDLWVGARLNLIAGARYNWAAADAAAVRDPLSGGHISIADSFSKAVGTVRSSYRVDPQGRWNVFGGISQGFRAPNLSDLTRFDIARTNEIETPAPGLQPESFTAYEIGFKAGYGNVVVQLAYFHTRINGMIVGVPTGRILGSDAEVTKKNAGKGYIQGGELEANYRFHPQWKFSAAMTVVDGRLDSFIAPNVRTREPVSRLMPTTALLGLRWEQPGSPLWLEGDVRMAGEQDNLTALDRLDTQRIPPGGTPGYVVFATRGGIRIGRNASVSTALENINNRDYRIHGSGLNEPGRNLVFALDVRF
ncbi:MAG: TonB-dependent receptor [Acidobacteria bacterium]|nr:TonB-dependent receptor [Acidobacteriota bacterium]